MHVHDCTLNFTCMNIYVTYCISSVNIYFINNGGGMYNV